LEKDYRIHWFENKTRTIDIDTFLSIFRAERDYVVLPEDLGGKILEFPGRKVIFNKNLYYGFSIFGRVKPAVYPYLHPDIIGVMTVSNHNTDFLRFAYPHLTVVKVDHSVDSEMFVCRPVLAKKRQIAVIPKSPGMLKSLYHMLISRSERGHNNLRDYEWVWLSDKPQRELSTILQDSLIFIFLSVEEGLGRAPIEAMACGCLVAGFCSGPPREYLPPEFGFEYGDLIGIARFVEDIAESFPDNIEHLQCLSDVGRNRALAFSRVREEESILDAWKGLLSQESE